jgi:hypothetical protein
MNPIDPLDLFERQNQEIGISPLEDPLSRQLSLFEKQMELPMLFEPVLPVPEIFQPVADPFPQVEKPAVIIPGGPKSDNPPILEESWFPFRQPPLPGFGRVRASSAGIRRNNEGIWCFHSEVYVEHEDCMSNDCGYWSEERMECIYMESQDDGQGDP